MVERCSPGCGNGTRLGTRMSNIRFAPEVEEDLEGSYDFIARDNAEAAARFTRMADATFEMLANNPYIGVHREFGSENLSDMRSFRIKNFEKYLILPPDPRRHRGTKGHSRGKRPLAGIRK
jgi:plasmid stabilization system protein ParE